MAKPIRHITPETRLPAWKRLWATPRLLSQEEADAAFEEFQEGFVPGHMRKYFLKSFGVPKAVFGNRYFMEDSAYRNWDMKISSFAGEGDQVEATVMYASPDRIEAYTLRGERRRSLRDIVVDDWQAACAIVRAEDTTMFIFIEPKMRGCIVRAVHVEGEENGALPSPF